VSKVFDHNKNIVYESKDPDNAILWMWKRIAKDLVSKASIIGYTTDVVQAAPRVPVERLEKDEIDALRSVGIL
jgi:hypothetical protein